MRVDLFFANTLDGGFIDSPQASKLKEMFQRPRALADECDRAFAATTIEARGPARQAARLKFSTGTARSGLHNCRLRRKERHYGDVIHIA